MTDNALMEAKLNTHSTEILSNLLKNPPKLLFSNTTTLVLKKPFRELEQIWRSQVQNRFSVLHFVKKGETLTTISKQYGVSVQSIVAVNAKGPISKGVFGCTIARDRCQDSLNNLNRHVMRKITASTTSHHLLIAKTTGYFLVLVPLIAFCIRCIIVAIQHRTEGLNTSKSHHNESRSMRWKSALSDIREPELVDAASKQDSDESPLGEEPQVPFEEISDSFTKLEPAYQKFLAECGTSTWGYWRGGAPE